MMDNQDHIQTIQMIPLMNILVDEEFNCRGKVIPFEVVALAKDIENKGLLSPVIVSPILNQPGYFRLLAGFRRTRAHEVLKRANIAAIVRQDIMTQEQAVLLNLSENLHRKDLNILQEARPVAGLLKLGWTEQQIMTALSQTRGWVQIRKMLMLLPPDVQEAAASGTLTQVHIRDCYTVRNKLGDEAMYAIVRKIKEQKESGDKKSFVNEAPLRCSLQAKRQRKRKEIFWLMEQVQKSPIGNCFGTRLLGWCAGEASTDEIATLISNLCELRPEYGNKPYQIELPAESEIGKALKEAEADKPAETLEETGKEAE
jgi:ParB/RepB/Spo0J family partition protein